MSQTLPIENYQDLVDTAHESLMQIATQCKLMLVLLDSTGIQVPQFVNNSDWMKDFNRNCEKLFAKEKPWVKAGRKNLSKVAKELLLYLSARAEKKTVALDFMGMGGTQVKKEPTP